MLSKFLPLQQLFKMLLESRLPDNNFWRLKLCSLMVGHNKLHSAMLTSYQKFVFHLGNGWFLLSYEEKA